MTEFRHSRQPDETPFVFDVAPPPTEQDLIEEASNRLLARKMTRRRLFQIGGITLAATSPVSLTAGGVYLDQKMSEREQSEEVEVGFVNREAAFERPNRAILALPGFNIYKGLNVARDIADGCKDSEQVAGIRYGNKEFNIPAIFRSAETFLTDNHIQELDLYGHSMGGLVALEMATHLKDRIDGLKINTIVLDCTPIGEDSIRQLDEAGEWFIRLLNEISVYGGKRTNYAIEVLINRIERDQRLGECFLSARRKLSNENCSNRMAVQELAFMSSFKPRSVLAELPEETVIKYLCPVDPHGDTVIDNSIAFDNLSEWSASLTKQILLPGTGHANPGAHKKTYHSALRSELAPPADMRPTMGIF